MSVSPATGLAPTHLMVSQGSIYSGPGLKFVPVRAETDVTTDRYLTAFRDWTIGVVAVAHVGSRMYWNPGGGITYSEEDANAIVSKSSTAILTADFAGATGPATTPATLVTLAPEGSVDHAHITPDGAMLVIAIDTLSQFWMFRSQDGDPTDWTGTSKTAAVLQLGTDEAGTQRAGVRTLGINSMQNAVFDIGGVPTDAIIYGEYSVNATDKTLVVWVSLDDGKTWDEFWRVNNNSTQNFRHIHALYQCPYDGDNGEPNPIIVCLGDNDIHNGIVSGPSTFADLATAKNGWSAINVTARDSVQTYCDANDGWTMGSGAQKYRAIDMVFHNGKIYQFPDATPPVGVYEMDPADLTINREVWKNPDQLEDPTLFGGGFFESSTPGTFINMVWMQGTSATIGNRLNIYMTQDCITYGKVGYFDLQPPPRAGSNIALNSIIDSVGGIRLEKDAQSYQDPLTGNMPVLIEDPDWDGVPIRLNSDFYAYFQSTSSNDGTETVGSGYSNAEQRCGAVSGVEKLFAFYFTILGTIKPTATSTIKRAWLTSKMYIQSGTQQPFVVEVRSVGTAAQPVDPGNLPSSWTVVSSAEIQPLPWVVDGMFEFDVTDVIQAWLATPGFTDNKLNIRLRTTDPTGTHYFYFYNGTTRLNINWK